MEFTRHARGVLKLCCFHRKIYQQQVRWNAISWWSLDQHRNDKKLSEDYKPKEKPVTTQAPRDYKYVYPEFLPDPDPGRQDRIATRLERRDMLRRRKVIDIPEFYVGSIMAVTVADNFAPGKTNRFVGLCIHRGGHGVRGHFTLRNIVDDLGVEIMYEIYNPTLHKIEVLKLEKRLDDYLYYLRDAPKEFSTVPFNFEPIPHPPGAPVPVNNLQIELNPRPWHERWERSGLKGIHPNSWKYVKEKMWKKKEKVAKPWEKYDLMKQYRESINDVDTEDIMAEVHDTMKDLSKEHIRKRISTVGKNKFSQVK